MSNPFAYPTHCLHCGQELPPHRKATHSSYCNTWHAVAHYEKRKMRQARASNANNGVLPYDEYVRKLTGPRKKFHVL